VVSKLRFLVTAAVLVCTLTPAGAQNAAPKRPRITGISHVAYFVSDLPKAISFWHDFLGYDQYFELKKPGTDTVRIAFIKISDRQHVELFNEPATAPPSMMSHLCFTVDNVEQMRAYLRSQGVQVPAGNDGKTKAGDYAFEIKDPDGTIIEFVQTLPDGVEAQAAGKFMPPTRISDKIYHVGFIVGNTQKAMDFYSHVLGFTETWRGTPNPTQLSWINMKVPDGDDYVEFMLYRDRPKDYGGSNHVALAVPSIPKATAELQSRAASAHYTRELAPKVGVNQKRQLNLFDPDGTRVELMEPFTVTGKPTPPSTAPPPPPAHD
jgi:lactoylglutathione lyase